MKAYPFITTGSPDVDRLLGGGLKTGRLVSVFGRSNSGKTQLAMQATLCSAREGFYTLFVDTEGTFRPERIEEMARARGWPTEGVLERVVYLRCDSAAEQAEIVRTMPRRKETAECRLVVIDTLSRNFSVELGGEENMPGRQGALNAHLSQMSRDAFLHRRAYLLANRVTFDRAGNDVGIGGRTVSQLVHSALHLEKRDGAVRVTEATGIESASVRIDGAGFGASQTAEKDSRTAVLHR